MKLYITEKPSQVIALKKVIKEQVLYAPLAGHIFRQYRPTEYNDTLTFENWHKNSVENVYPFFPKEFKKKVSETSFFMMNGKKLKSDYKKKFNDIKPQIEQCDEIVIASDPDNEGVVLAMEVIEACGATDKVIGMINMAKLDPISLAKEVKIMNKIPYKLMNDAGNTRAQFDWLFGMGLSPIASVYLGRGQTVHMGGVKLPTIRMIVERDIAFESFDEIPFWEIKGIAKDPKTGKEFPINFKYDGEERFDSEDGAKNALKELGKSVKINDYKEANKTSAPPKPYSLTDLQSEASRMLKINTKMVADIAQRLYSNGDQSYPRTEENFYAEGQYVEIGKTVGNLQKLDKFKNINLATPYKKRAIFNDKKLEGKAHTALCPTMQEANVSSMSDLDKKVYLLVATRYFIQFMEDYKYLNIVIKSKDGKFEISASENVEQSKGWKGLTGKSGFDDANSERTFPKLVKGDEIYIVKTELKRGTTKPKPRFTEASLLKAMERIATIYDDAEVKEHLGENGIGTPATRAAIIEDLKKTKNGKKTVEPYLKIEKGKIISTQKSRDIIEILPKNITSPVLRAELESMTKAIVYNGTKKDDVLKVIENKIKLFAKEIKEVSASNGIEISEKAGYGNVITEKQLAFAGRIADSVGISLPKECTEDKAKLKAWIDKHKENMSYSFSEKQREILLKAEVTKIKNYAIRSDLTKEEFDEGNKWIKDFFEESAKTRIYNLSEKQRNVIVNEKNKTPKTLLKMIDGKEEFTKDEFDKIQRFLKKIFSSWKK